jgi:hypothetical protein
MPTERTRSPSDTERNDGATGSRSVTLRAEAPTLWKLSRKDQSALLLMLARERVGLVATVGVAVQVVTGRRLEARGLVRRRSPGSAALVLTDAGREVAEQLERPLPLGGSFAPIADDREASDVRRPIKSAADSDQEDQP